MEDYNLEWDKRPCVSVVIASGGYPGDYQKGVEIKGLEEIKCLKDVHVFHAGTKIGKRSANKNNLFITDGGRVLNVTALGDTIQDAIDISYNAVEKIHFDKMHYRTDIAKRALEKLSVNFRRHDA